MMKVKTRKQPFSIWLFSAYHPLTSSFSDKDDVFGLYYEEAEHFFFFLIIFLRKDTCPPSHINVTNNWSEEKEVRTGVGKD